ncbi:MAG: hypothetical protein KF878_07510 [Planctomycetes bacterium]|nr:hypothetical protein [Planctomycetota bacterium]
MHGVVAAVRGALLGLAGLAAALVGAAIGAAAGVLVAGFLWLVVGGGDPRAPRALVALLEGSGGLAGAGLAVLVLSAPCAGATRRGGWPWCSRSPRSRPSASWFRRLGAGGPAPPRARSWARRPWPARPSSGRRPEATTPPCRLVGELPR